MGAAVLAVGATTYSGSRRAYLTAEMVLLLCTDLGVSTTRMSPHFFDRWYIHGVSEQKGYEHDISETLLLGDPWLPFQ